jgi:hypothetical protein
LRGWAKAPGREARLPALSGGWGWAGRGNQQASVDPALDLGVDRGLPKRFVCFGVAVKNAGVDEGARIDLVLNFAVDVVSERLAEAGLAVAGRIFCGGLRRALGAHAVGEPLNGIASGGYRS